MSNRLDEYSKENNICYTEFDNVTTFDIFKGEECHTSMSNRLYNYVKENSICYTEFDDVITFHIFVKFPSVHNHKYDLVDCSVKIHKNESDYANTILYTPNTSYRLIQTPLCDILKNIKDGKFIPKTEKSQHPVYIKGIEFVGGAVINHDGWFIVEDVKED